MSLNSIIDAPMSVAFEKYGAFFAYSQKQFDEQKTEGVTYVRMVSGLLCPKENVKALDEELDAFISQGIAQDIEQNGLPKIIARELANYECYYTGEITDAFEALEDYGVTKAQVWEVYHANCHLFDY